MHMKSLSLSARSYRQRGIGKVGPVPSSRKELAKKRRLMKRSYIVNLGDSMEMKKMRDGHTIIFAAESRRDLCYSLYVSENEGFRFH